MRRMIYPFVVSVLSCCLAFAENGHGGAPAERGTSLPRPRFEGSPVPSPIVEFVIQEKYAKTQGAFQQEVTECFNKDRKNVVKEWSSEKKIEGSLAEIIDLLKARYLEGCLISAAQKATAQLGKTNVFECRNTKEGEELKLLPESQGVKPKQ